MEYLQTIIDNTLNSFDFAYCVAVNVLTYILVKTITEIRKKELKTIVKKLILLASILLTGGVYYCNGYDTRLLLNSAIIAPVSWDWIIKPIIKKLKLDYSRNISEETNEDVD